MDKSVISIVWNSRSYGKVNFFYFLEYGSEKREINVQIYINFEFLFNILSFLSIIKCIICAKRIFILHLHSPHIVCLFLCVYVCAYVCMCVYVCVCMCVHMCVYVWVCMCVCMCVYVCMWVCMWLCVCLCVGVFVCVCVEQLEVAIVLCGKRTQCKW